MSTASVEEEELEHLQMAEVTTVDDKDKTTNEAVGKMPDVEEEEVTVLQKGDLEEANKSAKTPTEVIVIDDDDDERREEDVGIEEEEDVEDNPLDYEDDDDVLMDDEVYTPLEDAVSTSYSLEEPEAESNGQSSSGSGGSGIDPNFATVLRYANVARQVLNTRHPKFRHLNNMEIVHKMVAKGKVVNPADDEEEDEEGSKDDMFLNPRETKILEQTERVRVCTEMRSEDDRSGTEIIEISEGQARNLKSKVMILGGGIPLEPVLAQKRLNEEVEKFRYDLQKHRRCWDNVVFKHPQRKVGWKVDPSTIVPKNNDENDPGAGAAASAPSSAPVPRKPLFAPGEVYSTDEDWDVELGKDKELVPGTISAWTFLDDDDEGNQPSVRQHPPLKNIQQQIVSGKYPQQFLQQGGSPSPQKSYMSQNQQQQSQGQPYFTQRPAASGTTKKLASRSRSSGVNKSSEPKRNPKDGKVYPKPAFSYSCLIALSLKNSKTGALPVSEIYKFMCDHFPYFNTAPSGWKNSVRHNLSLNKCFEKYGEGPPGNGGTNSRKGCLWALNPTKVHKMDEEVQKWSRKDPTSITIAMSDPENLELIERGELKRDYSGGNSDDEEEELVDGIPVTYTLTGNMPIEFGTITSVTGNYYSEGTGVEPSTSQQQVVVSSANSDGMTYSVVNYGNEGQASNRGKGGQGTTPLIIRRTVVKS